MWYLYLTLSTLLQFSNVADSISLDSGVVNHEQKATTISDAPENCIFLTSKTGHFTYMSANTDATVCGIYLVADPDKVVKITFTEFDVPCNNGSENGSLVQYLDGWELNGQVFPNIESVTQTDEKTEFCSDNKPTKTFVSSQNGALISYRITEVGKGFTILVEHRKHEYPCNIIHLDEPYFILKNYGNRVNCSIWAPYPTVFNVNSYNIGSEATSTTGHECSKSNNRIEIGGGGLDTNNFKVVGDICDGSNTVGSKEEIINCDTSIVKLVSDGNYHNFANISMRPATDDEVLNPNAKYTCTTSSSK